MGKTEKGEKADNIKASHSVSFADVDAIKNERHTKASSKATVSSIESKGEEASNLKNEKTTKATSKATVENKTEKGEEADNLKNEKATKASDPDTVKSIESKGETANSIKNKEVTHERGVGGWKPDTRHSIA